MARSGTTLLADLLFRLGLFIGHKRIVVDQEAKYFVSVNDTLLKRVHGYWDHPAPMLNFLDEQDAVAATASCMQDDLRSARVASYLGWKQFLKYRSVEAFDKPWGWKDPRNVFTLPLWLRLFPEAKIIYIVRNGIDVAESLLSLERTVIARRQIRNGQAARRLSWRSRLERSGFKGAARCLTLTGGFSLWEEYVAQADAVLGKIANERVVFRYEDFLADPKTYLMHLSKFCALDKLAALKVDAAAARVDQTRSYAFLSRPELVSFYRQVKTRPWMTRHNYGEIA
jgi:hypothetical protein